jgi:WD40 repeat protein
MRSLIRILATMTAILAAVPMVKADLTLSVVAESVEPAQLAIGQTVRFDVVLAGLAPGDALDYLAGTVTYEAPLLGTASDVTPGGIVPDPSGFVGVGFDGVADAFYDAVFFSTTGTPITANGVFYSGGQLLWTSPGGVKVAGLAFSPDGLTLAWGREDGVVQRLDLSRRELLAPMHSELRCLAFSPDGLTLAAAGKSGAVHLWDPILGQELLTLEGRPVQANALAFAPDGSALAACWHDGTVRIIRSG